MNSIELRKLFIPNHFNIPVLIYLVLGIVYFMMIGGAYPPEINVFSYIIFSTSILIVAISFLLSYPLLFATGSLLYIKILDFIGMALLTIIMAIIFDIIRIKFKMHRLWQFIILVLIMNLLSSIIHILAYFGTS